MAGDQPTGSRRRRSPTRSACESRDSCCVGATGCGRSDMLQKRRPVPDIGVRKNTYGGDFTNRVYASLSNRSMRAWMSAFDVVSVTTWFSAATLNEEMHVSSSEAFLSQHCWRLMSFSSRISSCKVTILKRISSSV